MKRLHGLDALRGFAALSVVVWHWHFFFPDGGAGLQHDWTAAREPFAWLLTPFYVQGWAAVDLFFALSGFVFFWLYGDAIRTRAISGGDFALLRISRLYPLHLATLLAVAVLQFWFFRSQGRFFIYDINDGRHFASQLLMMQNWWPRAVPSFNGPAWSVSIELMLYVAFFIACRYGLKQGLHCLLLALLGGLLLPPEEHIARGVIGFFMGGFVFTLWQTWKDDPRAVLIARGLGSAALAGWALLWFLTYRHAGWFASGEANNIFLVPFDFLLCPLTVLALALREHVRGPVLARFGFLGDISYATYLLHFPMLLAVALAGSYLGLKTGFFMQGWVMTVFFAALIGVAALVHYRFERPLQQIIRGGALRRRAVTA